MDNYLSFKAKGMMASLYDIDGDVVINLEAIADFPAKRGFSSFSISCSSTVPIALLIRK